MRKLFSPGTIFAVLVLSFIPGIRAQEPVGPYCGTVTSAEGLRSFRSPFFQGGEVQASNILIYLDMDGAVVRSGFDSGDTYTSSIISGTRNLPAPNLTSE